MPGVIDEERGAVSPAYGVVGTCPTPPAGSLEGTPAGDELLRSAIVPPLFSNSAVSDSHVAVADIAYRVPVIED